MPGEGAVAELLIEIDASDEASSKIEKFGTSLDESTQATEEFAASANKTTTSADAVGSSLDKSGVATTSYSEKISNASTKFATLGGAVNNVMGMMDRYQLSQMSIENATNSVASAQDRLNAVIAQYGPDSQQATDAARGLENAQNGLTSANIQANGSMVMIGLSLVSMIPQIIGASTSVITFAASGTIMATMGGIVTTALGAMSAGFSALTAVIVANPIAAAIVLIIAAVIAFKYAWDNNFMGIRDIAGAVFEFIDNNFKWLIDIILGKVVNTLGFLADAWDYTFKGMRNLAGAVFEFIDNNFKWLADIIRGVIDTLGFLTGAQDTTKGSTKELDTTTSGLNTTMVSNATVTANASTQVIAFEKNLRSQGMSALQVSTYMGTLNASGVDLNLTIGILTIQSNTATTAQSKLAQQLDIAKLAVQQEQAAMDAGKGSYDKINEATEKMNTLQGELAYATTISAQTIKIQTIMSNEATTAQGKLAQQLDIATLAVQQEQAAMDAGKGSYDKIIEATKTMNGLQKDLADAVNYTSEVFEYLAAKGISVSETIIDAMILAGLSIAEIIELYSELPGGGGGYSDWTDDGDTGWENTGWYDGGAWGNGGWTNSGWSDWEPGYYAEGGIFSKPTLGVIAEAGPEAVVPLDKYGFGGAAVTINFNAPIYGVSDLETAIDKALNRVIWNVRSLGG